MSFLEDDVFDTFSKRGLKGVLDGIFKKENSRNVQENYCEKLGNFQEGLNLKNF